MPTPTARTKGPAFKAAKPNTNPFAAFAAIQRKLDRWELNHLRQHAADLADRLQRAELDLTAERACADSWRENCFELMSELQADGKTIGLTQAGQIGVMA